MITTVTIMIIQTMEDNSNKNIIFKMGQRKKNDF